MIVGCKKDACRYIDGFYKAKQKVDLLKQVLGDDVKWRVIIESMSAVEGNRFSETINEFYDKITKRDVN